MLVFGLCGAWFASPGTHIAGSGPGEMVIVLATMVLLVILAGVAIYVLRLQNGFDHFTDVALIG